METLLRLPEVERATGLKRSAIYARITSNEFPKPVRLTARTVGWLESEITDWINQRVAASRNQKAAA